MARKTLATHTWTLALLIIFAGAVLATVAVAETAGRVYRIGFFEAGMHPPHSAMRTAFRSQLERIVPEEMLLVFPPNGFYSAGWNRDSSRAQARRLASQDAIDLVCTFGPWVVEDLMATGFTKPIVAMYRADPIFEKLAGADGRPKYRNLTVDIIPNRLRQDLALFSSHVPIKRLGVLYFPSGDERSSVHAAIDSLGLELQFDAVSAEGQNAIGTFAFFKAYEAMKGDVDAVYAPFLWDMSGDKFRAFYDRLAVDRVPVFSSEGRLSVERGAVLSQAHITVEAQAWFDAWKALRILKGESPDALPTSVPWNPTTMVNEGMFQRLALELSEDLVTESELIPAQPTEEIPHYSLSDALLRALAQNPGQMAAQERMQAAAAEASRAWSQYLPQVKGTATAYHFDDHAVENDFNETKNDRYTGSVVLEQKLFSLGAIRSIQVESARRKLADIDYQQDSLDLTLAVTAAFLDCLKADELVAAAVQSRRAITHCLEMARMGAFIAGGDSRVAERLRSEQLLATAQLLEAKQVKWSARVLFNALLNQAGDTPYALDTAGFGGKESAEEQYVLWQMLRTNARLTTARDYLVAQAIMVNPKLRRARQEIDIQVLRLSLNSARFFPNVSLTSAVQYSDRLRDYRPSFAERDFSWYAGVNLELPLFLGGDRRKERTQLKFELSSLEFSRDRTALDVMRAVNIETGNLISALRESALLNEALGLQNPQLESVVGDFVSGKSGYMEVLDAVRTAYDISERGINAKYGYWRATAHLLHAVGWPLQDGKLTPGRVIASRLAASGVIRR